LIRHALARRKPVAAVGPGAAKVLSVHGALDGRKVPRFPGLTLGAQVEDAPVVGDAAVVVGVGGSQASATAFADAVSQAVKK
jgi:hypothetical protein